MANTIQATISVPDLPDVGIWFANAAAWKAYWAQAITLDITPATNAVYVENPLVGPKYYNISLDLDGDGLAEDNIVPSKEAFDQLVESYKNLRQVLKDAGIITQAQ